MTDGATPGVPSQQSAGWAAQLHLDYQRMADHTVLTHSHVGPLRVQRPFYPEGEVNHTYVLHPPGGLVGDDELHIRVNVHERAHALITTPGAAKAYRNVCKTSQLQQHFNVSGTLEWLPQETILFNESRVASQSVFNLQADARLLLWEVQCFGRPAGDLPYSKGAANFGITVNRLGRPLYADRLELSGGSDFMSAPWGLHNFTALGALLAYPADEALCAAVRDQLNQWTGAGAHAKAGVTLLNGLLVVRVLDDQAQNIRKRFVEIWRSIRPELVGRSACVPRIWNT
jgi:urease accessory protein